jgi:DNA segregation ATPase FtsK/SpoIIIE-like protein
MLLVRDNDGNLDQLFEHAIKECVHYDVVSLGFLQRRLAIGYARAARLLDQREYAGIVSPGHGLRPRKVRILKDRKSKGKACKEDTESFLWANAQLIINLLDAHGITVRLARAAIERENILFLFEVIVGAKFDKVPKLDKEIAAILAYQTGKVGMGAPFKGTPFLYIYLPIVKRMKEETYRAFDIDVRRIQSDLAHKFRSMIREPLFRVSEFVQDLGYKV